jgi:histone acetyltransferase (RNA polymerase elongator complex component)
MDDEVLLLSRRGHSAEDTRQAFRRLRHHGFKVGIQLMPGLPGDTAEGFRTTIEEVVLMHPEMVRLYPALVIRGTALSRWYQQGKYKPLGLQEAVDICKESCTRLEDEGIRVIRMGLMSSPSLLREGQILAGPWHPAFGFLVRAAIHHEKVVADLSRKTKSSCFKIYAPQREIPLIRGFKNHGLKAIEAETGTRVVAVEADDSLSPGHIRVEGVHRFPPSTG